MFMVSNIPQIESKDRMLLKEDIYVLQLFILPRYRRDKLGHFYSNFCLINQVETAIFVFPYFLENYRLLKVEKFFFSKKVSQRDFSDKLSEFLIFLAWPAILDIYSHGLLRAHYCISLLGNRVSTAKWKLTSVFILFFACFLDSQPHRIFFLATSGIASLN